MTDSDSATAAAASATAAASSAAAAAKSAAASAAAASISPVRGRDPRRKVSTVNMKEKEEKLENGKKKKPETKSRYVKVSTRVKRKVGPKIEKGKGESGKKEAGPHFTDASMLSTPELLSDVWKETGEVLLSHAMIVYLFQKFPTKSFQMPVERCLKVGISMIGALYRSDRTESYYSEFLNDISVQKGFCDLFKKMSFERMMLVANAGNFYISASAVDEPVLAKMLETLAKMLETLDNSRKAMNKKRNV